MVPLVKKYHYDDGIDLSRHILKVKLGTVAVQSYDAFKKWLPSNLEAKTNL